MKKVLHTSMIALLICVLIASYVVPCYAAEDTSVSLSETAGMSARLTNCSDISFSFSVVDPGEATFMVSYYGRQETFVRATLTMQIQKRFLGIFWRDIGDEWVGTSTDVADCFYGSVPVDGTGTYRAVMKLEIEGSTGVTDVVEDTMEHKYG